MKKKIAVDLVDIRRLDAALTRSPKLVQTLFHQDERGRSLQNLSSSFAAKECLLKVGLIEDFREFSLIKLSHKDNGSPFLESSDIRYKDLPKLSDVTISHASGIVICIFSLNYKHLFYQRKYFKFYRMS